MQLDTTRKVVVVLVLVWCVAHAQEIVTYVPTADCFTSNGGCNLQGDIWNGAISNSTTLIVDSNTSITLILSNAPLFRIASLSFGLSSVPVTILVSNSTFEVVGDAYWGNSSVLVIHNYGSFLCQNATGGIVVLADYGALSVDYGEIAEVNAMNAVVGIVTGKITNWNVTESVVIGYEIQAYSFYTYNSTFTATNLAIESYGEIHNTSVPNMLMSLYLVSQSFVAFHECSGLDVYNLILNPNSTLEYHSHNTSNYLTINTASMYNSSCPLDGSLLYLGDGVIASIATGYINNFTVGRNVTLGLGSSSSTTFPLKVFNLQQDDPNSLVAINGYGDLYLWSTQPVTASINVTGVLNVFELHLAANSSLFGTGSISTYGLLDCPSCNVEIAGFGFNGNYLNKGQANVNTLTTPFVFFVPYSGPAVNGLVKGNVVLQSSQGGGVDFSNTNSLQIQGSFTQIGGYLNFTWNTHSPVYLQANNSMVLQNVSIVVVVGDLLTKDKYLLAQCTSGNLSVSNTVVQNYEHTELYTLSLVTEGGGLYLGHKESGKPGSGLTKPQIYIIVGCVGGGIVLTASMVLGIRHCKHRRHHYAPISR